MGDRAVSRRAENYKIEHLRPFQPGEYRPNPDGSMSTELTVTVPDADGNWMNVPSLWMSPAGWVHLSEDEAAMAAQFYEQRMGRFPRYSTTDDAVRAATGRSHGGGVFNGNLALPYRPQQKRGGLAGLGGMEE